MNEQKKTFGRIRNPFTTSDAAHSVVRVAEALDWHLTDTDAFLRRAQHVEYGLSAEVEFAAILRWLGWCRFVHRLNEDAFEDAAYTAWEVPDLFAIFTLGGETCTAFIEVKTSDDLSLTFKKSYLQKLWAYAALMKQPLLVAWRPRPLGFWMLFDPMLAEPLDDERVQITLDMAMRNDLMSVLAGDYCLVPKEGAGLRFEAKRVGEKTATADGYEAMFEISDAYFHDAARNRVSDLPNSVMWMILSAMEHHQEVEDDGFVQSFTASGGGTRAQLVLRTGVGFSLDESERIHWKALGNNLDSILTCETLLADAQARFGTFVQYIFHLQPQQVPTFLPSNWRGHSPATAPKNNSSETV